ncbi:MAG: glycosyltransferase family 2 protein [Flavobacteriales bacterium]|nr:glycosyltransferase family 2 protein [Flavobacteriales bacterium]
MSVRPLISVIIPAYNAAPFLLEATRSVLEQTHTDLELIVVNDGSTDETSALARRTHDQRVRVIDQPNGGVSSARNAGLGTAEGEYIAFLDADDAMEPTALQEKLERLHRSNAAWVFGDLIICDALLHPTGRVMHGTDGDVIRTTLLGIDPGVPAMCSNALLRRSCFDTGYRFPKHLSNAADQHFVLAMARDHRYQHLPRALNRYRVLPHSMSHNVALYAADHVRLFEEAAAMGLLRDDAFARECRANAAWSIGGSWWVNGRSPAKALPHLLRAVVMDPSILLRRMKRARRRGTGN